jgi:hypothetical protein
LTDNPFRRFWSLGYQRLTPIIPPGAPISERSTLFKRIGTPQDGRGKTPGTRGRDGLWSSFDWAAHEADESDLDRWHSMSAGVGVKTGKQPDGSWLVAIDADTMSEAHAVVIRDAVDEQLQRPAVRVGRHPKALYIVRLSGQLAYQRIEFGDERVEVLSDGKQFVAEGIHPITGKPYSWPRSLPAFEQLPVFEPQQITQLLEDLRAKLPTASRVITEGAGNDVPQASLTGPIDAIRRAVAATPNTSNTFPSRESYRDYGYAIKAALPDDEPEALEIFQSWCARWAEGTNDPDVVEADWRRMKPPFRRGASWLFDLASEYGEFDKASVWWEPVVDQPEPLFPIEGGASQRDDVYPLLRLEDIINRPPPTFLIARHIPEIGMGFLYSVPGAGKSFLMLDTALTIAAGLTAWHGDEIRTDPDSVVLYIAAEGSFGFRNRAKAWMQAHRLENLPKRFLMIERTIDFMAAEDIEKLMRTIRGAGVRPCLVVVDTVSRAMPGADENLQKEMTLFVAACDRVKEAFRCAVVGVHHAGKNGDMRGSTVLLGAGDFVFRLERRIGATIGNLFCEKQKDAPDGWDEPYRFELVTLADGQTSLVVERADLSVGPSLELTPATSHAVLEAMRAAWEAGEPWSKATQAGDRRAVRRMVADFGFKASSAEELLGVWEQTGLVRIEIVDARNKKSGFRVLAMPDNVSEVVSVFD